MGLDQPQVHFSSRTADPRLIDVPSNAEGKSLFEPGNPAMPAIQAAHPHRAAVTRIGRVEVSQKIGGPDTGDKSPVGPPHISCQNRWRQAERIRPTRQSRKGRCPSRACIRQAHFRIPWVVTSLELRMPSLHSKAWFKDMLPPDRRSCRLWCAILSRPTGHRMILPRRRADTCVRRCALLPDKLPARTARPRYHGVAHDVRGSGENGRSGPRLSGATNGQAERSVENPDQPRGG